MDVLSQDELQLLLSERPGPHVSAFMPVQIGAVPAREHDRTRFKNLAREAEKQLRAAGLRDVELEPLLAPAQGMLEDRLLWQHARGGLAVFLAPEFARYYPLPFGVEELLVVGSRFHVAPLLPVTAMGRFYVLAISQNNVRLLDCTRQACAELEPQNVPRSLVEALGYSAPERMLQLHTAGPRGAPNRGAAVFHSAGTETDDAKDDILRYFQRLDRALHEFLRSSQSPLILAGVDYLLPLYREANTYPGLIDEWVSGNVERMPAEKLHEQAVTIMERHLDHLTRTAIERFQDLGGSGCSTDALGEAVAAAYDGRVESLLAAVGFHHWGTFDPGTRDLQVHPQPQPGDEDLVDFAVVHTLKHGGKVWPVKPEQMPGNLPLAAVLRY